MLEKLLDAGWNYHDTESERLAGELEAAARAGVPSSLLVPFLTLSTHTIGEHLGDWPRALSLGKQVLEGHVPAAETAKAWGQLYVAALLAKEPIAAVELELIYLKMVAGEPRAALLDLRFMVANALVGAKRMREGARLYRDALDLVAPLEGAAILARSIAVASNNLAWTLYEMSPRTVDDDALMQLAADTSLVYWRKCGTWINEEAALYLTALVANSVGDPRTGLAHADAALVVIAANGERPLDAARLHLARAAAFAALHDPANRLHALAEADKAAGRLTSDVLRQKFAAERTKAADGLS